MNFASLTNDIKRPLILDGGMGSLLERKGLTNAPVTYNLTAPEEIEAIHAVYLEAGADVITANTFGANSEEYPDYEKIISAGIKIAKYAAVKSGRGNIYIAADISPTGLLPAPMGDASFEQLYHIFKNSAIAAEKNGADVVLVETLQDIGEARAAILAVKENTNLPVVCSAAFNKKGRLLSGADALTFVSALESLGVTALGANCGEGLESVNAVIGLLLRYSSTPLIIQPNAGIPATDKSGRARYPLSPDDFAEYMSNLSLRGVHFLGGCCGTTPAHIKALKKACDAKKIATHLVKYKEDVLTSSYRNTVIWGESPILIGESIEPANAAVREALAKNDYETLGEMAVDQTDAGATIIMLDVGGGVLKGASSDAGERAATLKDVVVSVQAACPASLMFYEEDPAALEAAVRVYNGRALIHGVCLDNGEIERVFPIARKYGAAICGLCSGKDGLVSDSAGHIVAARKILARAAARGLERKFIILAPIAALRFLKESDGRSYTDDEKAEFSIEFARSIEVMREELRVKTMLGVETLTRSIFNGGTAGAAFFALALNAGLNGCCFNTSNAGLKKIFDARINQLRING